MIWSPLFSMLSALFALTAMADLRDWLEAVARRQKSGDAGERKVSECLAQMGDLQFENDLVFVQDGRTVQVDHVVRGVDCLWVVETKNWSGKVAGSPEDAEWVLTRKDGSVDRHHNPLWQNRNHVRALAKAVGAPCEGMVVMSGAIEHASGKFPWGVIRLQRTRNVLGGKARSARDGARGTPPDLDAAWEKVRGMARAEGKQAMLAAHMARLSEKYGRKPWRGWVKISLACCLLALAFETLTK